jgi:hypothetical protein
MDVAQVVASTILYEMGRVDKAKLKWGRRVDATDVTPLRTILLRPPFYA